jgi:hypothetical protein
VCTIQQPKVKSFFSPFAVACAAFRVARYLPSADAAQLARMRQATALAASGPNGHSSAVQTDAQEPKVRYFEYECDFFHFHSTPPLYRAAQVLAMRHADEKCAFSLPLIASFSTRFSCVCYFHRTGNADPTDASTTAPAVPTAAGMVAQVDSSAAIAAAAAAAAASVDGVSAPLLETDPLYALDPSLVVAAGLKAVDEVCFCVLVAER